MMTIFFRNMRICQAFIIGLFFAFSNTHAQTSIDVLIAASPGTQDWILDVEQKIESLGSIAADVILINQVTPTLAELQSYDAVLVFTDAGPADSEAFGDVLAAYIDGGGSVVDATFTPNVPITGGFTAYQLYTDAGQSNGNNLGIGTRNIANHPILNGVSTFSGGTASFHNTNGTIAAGADVVAEYTDDSPLIIVHENVGLSNVRRAYLNFYPPSFDERDDFWDVNTDGDKLMVNAIDWLLGNDISTNDDLCFPVVASNGKIALVCL